MLRIVKSLLGKSEPDFVAELQLIISDEHSQILSADEKDVFSYLNKEFSLNKQFPTEEVFLLKFPQYRSTLSDIDPLTILDLRYYRKQFITKHQNLYKSKLLYRLASEAATDGISLEMAETVRKQASSESEVEEEQTSFRDRYLRNMKNNAGLKTYVEQIDDAIGSIPKGAVCTLAGHTGSFKTTWAVNMAVKNALEGKNIVYISLEVAEDQLEYSILSLFSNDQRFTRAGYHPLEHIKIRKNELYEDELNFLCDTLEPEYRRVITQNLHIVDRSRFKTYSESEFIDILYQLDDEKPIDAVFIDHVGELALRSPLYNGNNTGAIINKYVSFFGEITVDFRKKDGQKRQISTVLLAQTNRTGFKAASASFKKLSLINRPGSKGNQFSTPQIEGYNTTALSDANELERFSAVVMTVFVNPEMLSARQAYVQVIKSRYCQPIQPTPVDIDPAVYKFGGDASVDASELSADLVDSLASCSLSQKSAGTNIYNDSNEEDFYL